MSDESMKRIFKLIKPLLLSGLLFLIFQSFIISFPNVLAEAFPSRIPLSAFPESESWPSDLQILEIHTPVFFKQKGYRSFDDFTDKEIQEIVGRGFNTLWIMGVWEESEFSRIIHQRRKDLPDGEVFGSKYAIPDYVLNKNLGDERSLREFVKRAKARGLRIMLDFIPNHRAIDSPLIDQHPEWFIHLKQAPKRSDAKSYFEHQLPDGTKIWVAYANGIYKGVPLTDLAQFNLFDPGALQHLLDSARNVAGLSGGGGLRIDDLVSLFPQEYRARWYPHLSMKAFDQKIDQLCLQVFGQRPKHSGFVLEPVLALIKKDHPDIKFFGETYREQHQLWQDVGFDLTYNKLIFDRLVWGFRRDLDWMDFKDYVFGKGFHETTTRDYCFKSVYFLENHDENKRIIQRVKREFKKNEIDPRILDASKLLAACITTIPGVPMFYIGQIEGHLAAGPTPLWTAARKEKDVPELISFYKELLNKTQDPVFRRGMVRGIPFSVEGTPKRWALVFARVYQNRFSVVALNHFNRSASFTLDLPKAGLGKEPLKLNLPPWGIYISEPKRKDP